MITNADGEILLRAGSIGGPANYNRDQASEESGLVCLEATRTQQQFAEDADINTIVKRFGITGELPVNLRTPLEGEFFETLDYQQALNALANAQQAFDDLPATVRSRFNNDPGQLIDFLQDEKNRAEADALGLTIKAAAPAATTPAEPLKEG